MKRKKIRVGDRELVVKIADKFFTRMLGLAWRERIDCDGMLLLFPFRFRWAVWMLGMRVPLDLIWLDGDRIVSVERGIKVPGTLREALALHGPLMPADSVIEIISNCCNDY